MDQMSSTLAWHGKRTRRPTQVCVEVHRDLSHQLDQPPRRAHGVSVHGRLGYRRLGIEEHIRRGDVGSRKDPPRIGRYRLWKVIRIWEAGPESFQCPLKLL